MLGLDVGEIRAHEFHYFDSTACGDAFRAGKPVGNRGWDCIWGTKSLIAGFPICTTIPIRRRQAASCRHARLFGPGKERI